LGTLLGSMGRTQDAEEEFGLALNVQTPLEGVIGGQEDLARTHDELGQLLQKSGRLREAARHYAEVGGYPRYSKPSRLNNIAWFLATCPDREAQDPARAVEIASKCLNRIRRSAFTAPDENGGVANTLGVAHYRNGQ